MTLHHLTVPPTKVRHLTNEQAAKVDAAYPALARSPYRCDTCKDTGRFRWYVPEDERDLDSVGEYECDCRSQFLMRRRFLHSGILTMWQKMSWVDYTWGDVEVLEACLDYLDRAPDRVYAGRGLCLWSEQRGTGKSMATMMLAKGLVLDGYDVYANTFSAMLEAFSAGWTDRADRRWYNERIRNATVLVIDDVGKERNKGVDTMGANALEEVLRHRVQSDLPTIFTTNFDPQRLEHGYGRDVTSLLSEKVQMVQVHGRSSREEKAARDAAEDRLHLTRPVMP